MVKENDTKSVILEKGLDMASELSLESITIGLLSKALNMSKSGLFAHFQSKENLQMEILQYAGQHFAEQVILPTIQVHAGLPRIKALVNNWIKYSASLSGGCIFVTASTEYSDRPGNIRNLLLKQQQQWIETMGRICQSAIKAGDIRGNCDCAQFAYDLYSLMLGFHFYDRLLQDPKTNKHKEKALENFLKIYSK